MFAMPDGLLDKWHWRLERPELHVLRRGLRGLCDVPLRDGHEPYVPGLLRLLGIPVLGGGRLVVLNLLRKSPLF